MATKRTKKAQNVSKRRAKIRSARKAQESPQPESPSPISARMDGGRAAKLQDDLKQRLFQLYTERRSQVETLSSRQFVQDPYFTEHPEDLVSVPSVNRIIREGMAKKWPGWERLSGCCPKHHRYDITKEPCPVCKLAGDFAASYQELAALDPATAAEVVAKGSPTPVPGFAGTVAPIPLKAINRHKELAARVLKRLPANSPLLTFIDSSKPIETFPNYVAPNLPPPPEEPIEPYIYVPTAHPDASNPQTQPTKPPTDNFVVHSSKTHLAPLNRPV